MFMAKLFWFIIENKYDRPMMPIYGYTHLHTATIIHKLIVSHIQMSFDHQRSIVNKLNDGINRL